MSANWLKYGYDYIYRNIDSVRIDYRLGIVRGFLRSAFDNSSLRHWYSRVLHGVPLGTSVSRWSVDPDASKGAGAYRQVAPVTLLFLLFLSSIVTLFVPADVFADVILSNTVTSSNQALGAGVNYFQRLGTGLSGTVTQINLSYSAAAAAASGVYAVVLNHCDNSGYTVNCVNDWADGGTGSGNVTIPTGGVGSGTYSFATSTGISLNPAKYYIVGLAYVSGTQHNISVNGSAADVFSGGVCVNAAGTPLATVVDCYFSLVGAGSYTSATTNGIQSIITPFASQTTSSSIVTFSFTYYVQPAQGIYTTVGYSLMDLTSGTNIDTTDATSTIGASGLSTYSSIRGLVSGHIYIWRPYMSGAGLPTLYGAATEFYVVTNQSTYVSNGGFFPSTSSPISWPVVGSGTTSTSSATSIGSIPNPTFTATSSPWGDILQKKFPFSYFYDLGVLVKELEQGTTTSGVIGFVTPTLFGVTPTTSTFVIADFNNLPSVAQTPINSVRTWIKYGLWLMFGMYAPYMIIRAL